MNLDGLWRYRVDEDAAFGVDNLPSSDHWKEMEIPNNWHLAGLENYNGVVWFHRRFSFSPNEGKRVWLRFLGVDYFARVWLNGIYLGEHEGYFQPFEFDITEALKTGENELLVRADSPKETPGEEWPDKKRLIKGVFNHHDCRPGAWDPIHGQDKNTGGIWNSVIVYETSDIRIKSLRIAPTVLDDGTAVLTVKATVENYRDAPARATLELEIRPDNFLGETLTREWEELLPPGRTQIHRVVRIENPSLWWTWEHGEQNLYRAELGLYQNQQLQDERSERFGIREITVDKEHGWKLNGKPFFPRGTNVIPAQWLAEYDEAKIAKDITLLREANVNAVRVHAHVTRPEFYEACDEAGILVWQDFPLQWSYEESEEFYNNAGRQLREMIALLYNHPSIGVWCCHNEPSTNTGTLDNFLYEAAKEADGSRYIEHHSDYREHPYPGWYYGHWTLFACAPGAPFVNEFGAQALPSIETMKRMLPTEELWPPDWEAWAYHDFQYDQTFNVAEIRTGDSLEEFVKNSQEYQYRLLKLAIESYRYDPQMTGIFQFMFMDPWPSITWSVVDYWRNPKKGYRALQIGFQPVLISFITGRDRFVEGARDAFIISDVVIINDLNQALRHTEVHLWFEDEGGKPLIEETYIVDIPANDHIHVSTPMMKSRGWMLPKGILAGRYTLHGEVIHEEAIISKNEQDFVVLSRR